MSKRVYIAWQLHGQDGPDYFVCEASDPVDAAKQLVINGYGNNSEDVYVSTMQFPCKHVDRVHQLINEGSICTVILKHHL